MNSRNLHSKHTSDLKCDSGERPVEIALIRKLFSFSQIALATTKLQRKFSLLKFNFGQRDIH